MAEPYLATANIEHYGVLAFTPGQIVPDEWVKDHPDESKDRVARRNTKAATEAVAEVTNPDPKAV